MSLDPIVLIDRPLTVLSPHGEVQGQILAVTKSDVLVRWISPQRSDEIRADWFNQATLCRGMDLDTDLRAVRLKCLPWRVLITGAAGFLGLTLARHLRAIGYSVIGLDQTAVSINDQEQFFEKCYLGRLTETEWVVHEHQPDVIYHLAAMSHVKYCHNEPGEAFHDNAIGTQQVLEVVRICTLPPRLIIAGSGEEYGESTACTPDSPLKPRNIYGASKAAASMLAIGYASAYNLPIHVVRMANLYGPGQSEEKFIPLVIGKLLRGEIVELHANGTPVRDWLYVDDACDALIKLGLGPKRNDVVFNLPGYSEHTLLHTTTLIRGTLAYLDRNDGDVRLVDSPSLVGSVRMIAQDKLDWQPMMSLKTGIVRTVEAYLAAHATPEESQPAA